MDGSRTKKSEVIEYVLEVCNVAGKTECTDEIESTGSMMYLGAKSCGLSALGVLYGYGDREELEQAGAEWIVDTPAQILKQIL